MNLFTTQEKLSEIEAMIEELKRSEDRSEHRIRVLAAIAADIRARLDGVPSTSLVALERRIAAAVRSKMPTGYTNGSMVGIGQELIGHWPIVKQALENLEGG